MSRTETQEDLLTVIQAMQDQIANLTRTLQSGVVFRSGDMKIIPTNVIDQGWLLCQGMNIQSLQYPNLDKVFGASAPAPWTHLYAATPGVAPRAGYFALPDFSGRIPTGAGTPAGVTSGVNRILGTKGGGDYIWQAANQVGSHVHGVLDDGHAHGGKASIDRAAGPDGNYAWLGSAQHGPYPGSDGANEGWPFIESNTTGIDIDWNVSPGTVVPMGVWNPYLAVNIVVKT